MKPGQLFKRAKVEGEQSIGGNGGIRKGFLVSVWLMLPLLLLLLLLFVSLSAFTLGDVYVEWHRKEAKTGKG